MNAKTKVGLKSQTKVFKARQISLIKTPKHDVSTVVNPVPEFNTDNIKHTTKNTSFTPGNFKKKVLLQKTGHIENNKVVVNLCNTGKRLQRSWKFVL